MAKRPPQSVNIGHTSAREHFFQNTEPAHSKFKKIQTRENAVACAKAIWELRDYHWRDTIRASTRATHRKNLNASPMTVRSLSRPRPDQRHRRECQARRKLAAPM